MGDPSWPFWYYVVATPIAIVVVFLVLRWAIGRFPTRTRRELTDLQMRVRTLETIVDHVARARDLERDLADPESK